MPACVNKGWPNDGKGIKAYRQHYRRMHREAEDWKVSNLHSYIMSLCLYAPNIPMFQCPLCGFIVIYGVAKDHLERLHRFKDLTSSESDSD